MIHRAKPIPPKFTIADRRRPGIVKQALFLSTASRHHWLTGDEAWRMAANFRQLAGVVAQAINGNFTYQRPTRSQNLMDSN